MDDLISRQSAVYAVDEMSYAFKVKTNAHMAFIKALADLPSAERRGRWISQEYMSEIDSFIYKEYKCSNCGEISKKKSNYCPNCGAKMDKCEVVSETGTPPEWGDRSWAFRGGAKKAEVEENG